MTDKTMPERITVGFNMGYRMWDDRHDTYETPYIRADLVPTVTDDAKREALEHIEFAGQVGNYYSVPLDSRIFTTIRAALQTSSENYKRDSQIQNLEKRNKRLIDGLNKVIAMKTIIGARAVATQTIVEENIK